MYKRKNRELSDLTKQKISASLRNRSKSYTHKQNISNGMKGYWASVPSANVENDEDDENKEDNNDIV